MAIEHDLVEFISVVDKFYNDNKYIREPKNIEFKNYRTEIAVISELGLSCNLCNRSDEKYLCSFEISLNSKNGYTLCFRMKDYSVLWEDGDLMYCTGLRDISNTPVFEEFKNTDMKICNDFDQSTLFQYRLIEEKADSILVLLNELRMIISTKKYSTLYRVHTRD